MREQWQLSCGALGSGDATSAVALFREFEKWYANEPEVNEPGFREMRTRLHGLACLQAEMLEDGIRLLDQWLTENASPFPYHAYIRFQLASACLSIGQQDEAVRHWQRGRQGA